MAALHSTTHVLIDIVPVICILTWNFGFAPIFESLDNQGWTVLHIISWPKHRNQLKIYVDGKGRLGR